MCYNEQAKNVDNIRSSSECQSSIRPGDVRPLMRMNEPITLGRWMKRRRADLDMTQEALAKQLGCAVQTIRTFEIGKRRPSRELAERLADVLQVPQEHRSDFVRAARMPTTLPSVHLGVGEQDQLRQGERHAEQSASTTNNHPDRRNSPPDSQTGFEQVPILATKLYMPRPRARLVSRSRLLAQLEAGLSGPLTVIAAPAGFGKTTVLADWLNQPAATSRQVTWLALDAGDADPHQFLRYLIVALQTIEPAIGGTTLRLLRAAQPPPFETRGCNWLRSFYAIAQMSSRPS
jgi:transcriptional regulator with XRE-family HTH domain